MTCPFDDTYADWKVGDLIAWIDDKESTKMTITEIDPYQRVFWQENGEECMTRSTNLLRVKDDAQ